jgi:sugar lactone lactonase YvrE
LQIRHTHITPQRRYEAHSGIPRTGWLAQGSFPALTGSIASNKLFDNGELLDRNTHRTTHYSDHNNYGLPQYCPELILELPNLIRNCTMKFSIPKLIRSALHMYIALLLAACGSGSGSGSGSVGTGTSGATPAGAITFSVGGTIVGVSGTSGVVLQDNNGDDLTVGADGSFTFLTKVPDGSPYNVTVRIQPTSQTCSVNSGSGFIPSSKVDTVRVVCSKDASSIVGAVTGLAGTVVLDNNGESLSVGTNGRFTFTNKVAYSSSYNVTVLSQPIGQTCTVSAGTGVVSSSTVGSVGVACTYNTYSVGGMVTGLTSLALLDNNGDSLSVGASGPFTFTKQVAYGNSYTVSVNTQPTGETCSVSFGTGVVPNHNVSNVAVNCSANAYSVRVTVAGLTGTGTVVLQDNSNSSDNLTVGANGGPFTFVTKVPFGSPYSVTVLTQPTSQNCSVVGGAGTMGSGGADVAIMCAANTYTVGGNVTQLNGSMMLQNNAMDNLPVSVNGPFSFPTTVVYNSFYNVSVLTQPTNQRCLVANGTGNATANINNVSLNCASQMGGSMQGIALNLTPSVSTLATGFNSPMGVTSDGTNLYVADSGNNMIRKIVIATGVVTTLAGTGAIGAADGAGTTTATFNYPIGITTDGTNLYVADNRNHKIRKITPSTGTLSSMTSTTAVVSSLTGAASTPGGSGASDSTGANASFTNPWGITTDGTNLYVVDAGNNKIRKIAPSSGTLSLMTSATAVVSSLTGATSTSGGVSANDGGGANATFNSPRGITTDGTNLYVTDYFNNKIRKIAPTTGTLLSSMTSATAMVSSFTGAANAKGSPGATDGSAAAAMFDYPDGITTDGTNLYVADEVNNKIRKIVIITGAVSTLAGTGAAGALDSGGGSATFSYPEGIANDGTNVYVTESRNNIVRKIQ